MRPRLWFVLATAVLVTCVCVRLRMLSVPLERDEGEYAYAGQLILDGTPPYRHDVYNMKLPGVYSSYAVIMAVFGETREAIHLGLLLINIATAVMIFFLGRRFGPPHTGGFAAAFFGVFSLSPSVRGLSANTEHFVVLFAVAGFWLLLAGLDKRRTWQIAAAGVLLGAGIMMKQHGAVFALVGFAFAARTWRWGLAFATGAVAPYALTCAVFGSLGLFDRFWFWTVTYAWRYVGSMPLAGGLERFGGSFPPIVAATAPLWAFALVGATRRSKTFARWVLLAGLLAVIPGLYFRAHYFVLAAPGVALAAAVGLERFRRPRLALLLALLAVAYVFWHDRGILFEASPRAASRAIYGANPFPEAIEIGEHIRRNSAPTDRIAVVGSEPEIYFYAARRAATGYIYTYALMESHAFAAEMQAQMIAEIERAAPHYFVYVNVPASWLIGPDSDRTILRWAKQYREAHYNRVGLIEILPGGRTSAKWGVDAYGRRPRSNCWIEVGRRR